MLIVSCMFGRGEGRGEVGINGMLEDGTVPARTNWASIIS